MKYAVSLCFSYSTCLWKFAERDEMEPEAGYELRLDCGFEEVELGHKKGLVELEKETEQHEIPSQGLCL